MILHPREKISYLRKEYGITQKELGQEEFSQSYIASLENGQRELRDEILLSIWKNFEKILKENNIENLHQLWPNMELYIHGGVSFAPYISAY